MSDSGMDAKTGGVPETTPPVSLSAAIDYAAKLVGLGSLLVALFFYFGWARTSALYRFFGVDPSVLGFSNQDYLMRSIQVSWQLIRWLLVGALGAILADFLLLKWLRTSPDAFHRWRLIVAASAAVSGLLLVAVDLLATWLPGIEAMPPLFYPLTWTIGVCLAGYSFHLFTLPKPAWWEERTPARGRTKRSAGARPSVSRKAPEEGGATSWERIRRSALWIFVGILVVSLFWTVSISADQKGLLRARQIATYLDSQPDVIVYSAQGLDLEGPGISFEVRCPDTGTCRYRYSGLKFLVRSGGNYFLLPAGWSPEHPTTIVLPEGDPIRVEFEPGTTPDLTP